MDNCKMTITLLKDKDWSVIDSEACRVNRFTPLAKILNGKLSSPPMSMPYCSLEIECKKFPCKVTAFVTHKIDFTNLWKVFKERGVKEDEEVIIFWTTKHYKVKVFKILLTTMPKLIVWICRKNAFEVLNDRTHQVYKELSDEEWSDFIRPIEDYRPDIMQ
jgi:hypothetical protein